MGGGRIRVDDARQPLEEIWPPFGLRIESPRLVLRVVRETDFPQYVAAATSGVVRTDRNPFVSPWNEQSPEELVRSSLPWLWSTRGRIGPDDWYLMFGVFRKMGPEGPASEGSGSERLIGMQDCSASHWRTLRQISSGSWLRADEQGCGYGREMRAAMLLWAFDHFDAHCAVSGAYQWNEASQRVSRGLGYRVSGTGRVVDAHGGVEIEDRFELLSAELIRPDWDVEVAGSRRLRSFFEGEDIGQDADDAEDSGGDADDPRVADAHG
ncbi:GNAT family N-acetyltransferase [Nesterenkonia marinintestina]|uniref:GNAT family N-acetyltransferase n=1 Tax=Nesterenkonia marinintestina TaxID=2979865 RepID=UPI0021BE644B|nr:GNAT family protein [Nesterenkonia sp. GX14115]